MTYLLPRAHAVFCGKFIIIVNLDYMYVKKKTNSPVFVYNDSHLSLKHQYSVYFDNREPTKLTVIYVCN